MLEFAVVVVCLSFAFLMLKMAYQAGAKSAAAEIAGYFRQEIRSKDNDLDGVPVLLARRSIVSGGSFARIAQKLYLAAVNDGAALQADLNAPKADETTLTMRTAELEDVAWLADSGLRVWISLCEEPTRRGERLKYGRAEALGKLLDTFERRIVPDLLAEAEDARDRRFGAYENRMFEVWAAYGGKP